MAIVPNVEQRCNCGFSRDNITSSAFQCFPDSPQAVTYRAVLHGTSGASSSQILKHIEQWISEGATVSIQSVIYNVDQNCVLAISSNHDNECKMADEATTFVIKSENNLTGGVIGGTLAVVLIMTLIIATSMMVVLFVKRRKKIHDKTTHLRY